ncbi:hypothetical protein HaLaN_32237, partial [Haematococcus lacustris]
MRCIRQAHQMRVGGCSRRCSSLRCSSLRCGMRPSSALNSASTVLPQSVRPH